MHGVINLLKPPGMTSHDAVAFVRRTLKIKRVGHTGTLDPAAAGVLPICVGQATRLVEYLQAGKKTYIAEATFGYETDTLDGVGKVTKEGDAGNINLETIRQALNNFRGEIDQIPPAFSAIKKDGQKLYDLARAGQIDESQLTPRRVTIHKAHPTHFFAEALRPRVMIHIECSSGTYIRSLVRDLGRASGCGATMTFLVRSQSGKFALENAVTLETIAANPQDALLPMEEVLRCCGSPVFINDEAAHNLSQGKRGPLVVDYFSREVIFINQSLSIAAIAKAEEKAYGADGTVSDNFYYKAEKVLFLNADS